MRRVDKAVWFFAFVTFTATWVSHADVEAKVERECLASYERTSDAYSLNRVSKKYRMRVQFATGTELNQATRGFKYDQLKPYVLLWFGKGKVAIIKLNGVFMVNLFGSFSREDFRSMFDMRFNGVEGLDQRGRKWRIECKQWGTYLDRRERDVLY